MTKIVICRRLDPQFEECEVEAPFFRHSFDSDDNGSTWENWICVRADGSALKLIERQGRGKPTYEIEYEPDPGQGNIDYYAGKDIITTDEFSKQFTRFLLMLGDFWSCKAEGEE